MKEGDSFNSKLANQEAQKGGQGAQHNWRACSSNPKLKKEEERERKGGGRRGKKKQKRGERGDLEKHMPHFLQNPGDFGQDMKPGVWSQRAGISGSQRFFSYLFSFETGSHMAQAGLKLVMHPRMALSY